MKQLKNERGLTLVELLAVIVILAIIAAIAAVAIGNVINNSKDKAILSDAVTIIDGAKIAVMDDEGEKSEDGKTVTLKKEELTSYVELSDDKWGDNTKVEITGESDGKTKYKITYDKLQEIKNNKYRPTETVSNEADLGQLLKALEGNGEGNNK